MNYLEKYNLWINNVKDEELLEELKNMTEEDMKEAFNTDISFGTAGLRGLLGAGSANMNIITVAKVTYGLVNYLKENFKGENLLVAISRDPRHKSKTFVDLIISILAENNIKSIIFDDVKPTPMLSYIIKYYNCTAGIMITASHNPKEYNGYKVYNKSGAQLNLDESSNMTKEVNKIDYPFDHKISDINLLHNQSYVEFISEKFDTTYFNDISNVLKNKENKNIKIIFSPEHGTTYKVLPKAFKFFGFKNIIEVKEQMIPDPNFSNTKSANPEEIEAYELAIEYAKNNDADLIIVNDPDGDRLGVVIKNKDGLYVPLSGNQTGALLIDYLIKRDNISNGIIYNTIVTSTLGDEIAFKNNVKIKKTLTGFKFIGEQIENNKKDQLIFAYEESYGYLINSCVRDKDAIQSSLLIAEMADFYKEKGTTLDVVLDELYKEYGYFYDETKSISLKGSKGMEKIKKIMNYFIEKDLDKIAGLEVNEKIDFNKSQGDLPKSNVIKFMIKDIGWFALRPSGTEPKLKIYLSIKSDDMLKSKNICEEIYLEISNILKDL